MYCVVKELVGFLKSNCKVAPLVVDNLLDEIFTVVVAPRAMQSGIVVVIIESNLEVD